MKSMHDSPLYSESLAPVPEEQRTWGTWALAALWISMAVCIPTYLLASYMIRSGLNWVEALLIIGLANLIITIPMVLNGHAGVKYGIPFPVMGRAAFGINGIHVASMFRAIVACGWFGVQTWIGGLAVYAIVMAATGQDFASGLTFGKFLGFAVFWFINIYFVWRGTESIKHLEEFAAPILLGMGVLLIIWGSWRADGFAVVLQQNKQLENPVLRVTQESDTQFLHLNPFKHVDGSYKADEYQLNVKGTAGKWQPIAGNERIDIGNTSGSATVQFRVATGDKYVLSSLVPVPTPSVETTGFGSKIWQYILWLTAMVGFWATMSISIADITRYAKSQKAQLVGQLVGLPGTMMLYSFVGVFVTCAAIISFDDILIANDAPWDPVSLISKFDNPLVVIVAQLFMIIATLSTNIAANVIAPANAFANLFPRKIDFKTGGLITGIIGIVICPWWLIDDISSILLFISGLLGPVLGVMIADYHVVRKATYRIEDFYDTEGPFTYGGNGINNAAMIAMIGGILMALVGHWVPALSWLYSLSWFTGFLFAFVLYSFMMKPHAYVHSHSKR